MIWTGAAALVMAILGAALSARRDAADVPKRIAEQDYFPFLKPMERIAPDSMRTSNDQQQAPAPLATQPTPTDIANAQIAAQTMRAQGATEDDIKRMRAAALPAETTTRLTEIDKAETAWNARVGAYLGERGRLLDSAVSVSAQDQQQVLQRLRDARFTAQEQSALAAYESSGRPQLSF